MLFFANFLFDVTLNTERVYKSSMGSILLASLDKFKRRGNNGPETFQEL